MRYSVCLTTLNEKRTIHKTIRSLLRQTIKPDEIIVVDAGSEDGTIEVLKKINTRRLKLFIKKGISRSEGRNFAIKMAKNDVVLLTDAGCVAKKDWAEKILSFFKDKKTLVVAGGYEMKAETSFEKAESIFLGVPKEKIKYGFLPSARSMAIKKDVIRKIGGFNPKLSGAAEDTEFCYRLVKNGVKIEVAGKGRVIWDMPNNLGEFFKKIYSYSQGDVKTGIWFHPSKGFMSHNIKALFVFLRYFLVFLFFSFYLLTLHLAFLYLGLSLLLLYIFYVLLKIKMKTKNFEVFLWGFIMQFVCDFAVILGFVSGFLAKDRPQL